MISENFRNTIDIWIKEVERYSFDQICKKPSQYSWSLGQVCNDTRQPKSKEEILSVFFEIKAEVIYSESRISNSIFQGKTKHPGLNYFNAIEWLQFAEMHFRHHLRQKNRIASLIKPN